ncbi:unnamed protein product [Spodoptera littoralis]|uniref:Uncharacterized protein n=1 Tax=Spodoptera littoralis TaxID=7109 RepID=A0A9P0I4R1_SPOLI|nr:unnamed protein product [Spodoptera littoralis]CAH1639404.1 unnamed protein product [Spodoptera littoralis]
MSETNKHNRNYAAAVTQLPEDSKSNPLPDNVSIVTQYKTDTDSHTQTDAKLKVLKAVPLTLVSSAQNLQTGLNKTEMVEDKLKSTQATETDGPSKMQPVQDGFKFKDTAQQSEQSRAIEQKQADKLTADNRYLSASVSMAGSLASNPDIGVIMHSKLATNNVRERGNAVKLYDGSETEYSNRLKLPMTEALVANQATTNEATEVSTPELCEQCAACTFDRECATRRRNTNDFGNTSIGKETKNEQVTKTDDHNSLQIPGPLPTDNYKERKRSIFSRFSIDKKKDKSKRNSKSDTVNSAAIAKNTTATTEGPIMLPDVPLIDQPGDDTRRNSYTVNKVSNNIQRKRNSRDRRPSTGTKDQGGNILEESNFRELMLSDRIMPPVGDGYKSEYENESTKTETKEQASQAAPDLRVQVQDELCTRRVSIFSEQQTYTVPNKTKRSASYDNTELEMSYLSDLPLEKDVTGKSPDKGRALSPGEDKTTTTTTYTESYCSPTTNYYSLSEGEVPTSTKRKVSYDNSYKDRRDDTTGAPRSEQSAAKMEAALRAIQDELARCKSLLQAQRPEVNSIHTPVLYNT